MGPPYSSYVQESLKSLPASARTLISGVVRVMVVLCGLIVVGVLVDWILGLRPIASDPWRWLGLALLFFGIGLEAAATKAFWFLGEGTPHPIQPPRRLVDGGPYAYSRNPLYLARLLILFGGAGVVGSVSTLGIGVLLSLSLEFILIPREEARLRARFGPDYDDYCARVGRWLNVRRIRPVTRPR